MEQQKANNTTPSLLSLISCRYTPCWVICQSLYLPHRGEKDKERGKGWTYSCCRWVSWRGERGVGGANPTRVFVLFYSMVWFFLRKRNIKNWRNLLANIITNTRQWPAVPAGAIFSSWIWYYRRLMHVKLHYMNCMGGFLAFQSKTQQPPMGRLGFLSRRFIVRGEKMYELC